MGPEETFDDGYQGEPADAGAPARPVIRTTRHDDGRPAQTRIAELFERMQPHRQVLQAILESCADKPRPFEEVFETIEAFSRDHRCIYTPEGFCDLLERAGALQKVTAEGDPLPEEDPEPQVVVENGVEYLEPVEIPEPHYVATEDAKSVLARLNPLSDIEGLFEGEERYLPVYKRVLLMCSQDKGATMPEIDAAILDDPLVQSPHHYASRFVTFLESAGAVCWKSTWHVTQAGREALEMLQGVEVAAD